MRENRVIGLVALTAIFLLATGCDWLRSITLGDSMPIVHKSPKLTLAWDPPLSDIPNRSTEVVSYQIFCREHGTEYWRLLAEIDATPHPEYTIDHSLLGDGPFDFAIRAFTVGGSSSALHSSLDSNANPMSGWYVLWAYSN